MSSLTNNGVIVLRRDSRIRDDRTTAATSSHPSVAATSALFAGYIAGSGGLVIGHPLDSLKVLAQTSSSASAAAPARAGAVFPAWQALPAGRWSAAAPTKNVAAAALRSHARTVRNLYAGISTPLATVGAMQALNFSIFDSVRRLLYMHCSFARTGAALPGVSFRNTEYRDHDTLLSVALASFIGGGAMAFVTSPIQVIKTKQQILICDTKTAARDILAVGGWRGFYMGFGAHLFCHCVGRAFYYPTYEQLKRSIAATGGRGRRKLTTPERMFCAGVAGIVCWTVIFPFDSVRSRICAGPASPSGGRSSMEMARIMYGEGGARPFYRGFGWTILRAFPVAAVVLPLYDYSLDWLS